MSNITLTPAQLQRLEKAIITPGRTLEDRSGNKRMTQAYINQFASDLVKFYRRRGYLTERQYARIAHIVQES